MELEVRTGAGSLLLQRTLTVDDRPPVLTVQVEANNGTQLDRVVGDGEERIRISVDDVDDPSTSFVGDLTLQWPGGEPIQLPLDIAEGENEAFIGLDQLMVPLEGGELQTASGRGKHGATASVSLSVPFLLTPPTVVLLKRATTKEPSEHDLWPGSNAHRCRRKRPSAAGSKRTTRSNRMGHQCPRH